MARLSAILIKFPLCASIGQTEPKPLKRLALVNRFTLRPSGRLRQRQANSLEEPGAIPGTLVFSWYTKEPLHVAVPRPHDRISRDKLSPRQEGVKSPRERTKRRSVGENSDVQVIYKWRPMDIENPPICSGIYAVTNTAQDFWYYIGKSQNIASRITVKNHPIQVTKNINIDLHYWYLRVDKKHIGWAERYLIKEFDPEWNGSTSFGASAYTQWVCCDLPLSNQEWTRRALLEAIGE